MLGSNFALLVKSPGNDGQQLLRTGSSYVYRWSQYSSFSLEYYYKEAFDGNACKITGYYCKY